MARHNSYIKYAEKIETEPQSIYLNSGSAYRNIDELRSLGTRRILFVCNKTVSQYKNIDKLIEFYKSYSFRIFTYFRESETVTDTDILAGLKIYKEYNCDTIVVAGDSDDINCAKMIAAAAANPVKKLSDLGGIDKLKRDISVLCCIVMDNGDISSSSIAEYCEEATGRWVTCMSAYLIPQIVCYDTDFSVRTDKYVLQISSLMALTSAVEAYLSPMAADRPKYRANAVNSCINIINNIDKMLKNITDSYPRRVCALGGMYAGLAMRKAGLGETHVLVRNLATKYKTPYGVGIDIIFPMLLRSKIKIYEENLAALAKELHLCTPSLDNESAANIIVDRICGLYERVQSTRNFPPISEAEAKKIVNSVKHEMSVYGTSLSIPVSKMCEIIVVATNG